VQLVAQIWQELWQEPLKKLASLATVVGVIVAIVGLRISNQHTQEQLALANKQLELTTRPYLHVVGARWLEVRTVTGDVGTQARLIVQNLGEKPARKTRFKNDFVIRITAPRHKEKLAQMSTPSASLNPTQEAFWNEYIPYRGLPVKELATFFRTEWNGQSEQEIQSHFNEKWAQEGKDYQCEVYGSIKDYYREPWTLAPGNHEVVVPRSTSREARFFTEAGGDILFVYVVLQYQGLFERDHNYELHYVGYFDSSNPWEPTGVFYPLMRHAAWDELDLTS